VGVLGEGRDVSRYEKKGTKKWAYLVHMPCLLLFHAPLTPLLCSVVSIMFSTHCGLLISSGCAAVGGAILAFLGALCGTFFH